MKQVLVVLVLAVLPLHGFAQITDAASTAVAASRPSSSNAINASKSSVTGPLKPAVPASTSKPAWVDLTLVQQQALKPLSVSWNTISESQKRKWLEISKNYSKLSPLEQTTMHSRMVEWVAMSPQDRAAARLNFAKTKELSKELTGEEKRAKWETYQALSPAEKARLNASASPKPVGAATAVKPVESQKLAVTPKTVPLLPKLPVSPPVKTAVESTPGTAPAASN